MLFQYFELLKFCQSGANRKTHNHSVVRLRVVASYTPFTLSITSSAWRSDSASDSSTLHTGSSFLLLDFELTAARMIWRRAMVGFIKTRHAGARISARAKRPRFKGGKTKTRGFEDA